MCLLVAASSGAEQQPAGAAVGAALRARLGGEACEGDDGPGNRQLCRELSAAYGASGFVPIWVGQPDLAERLDQLRAAAEEGRRHALVPSPATLGVLDTLRSSLLAPDQDAALREASAEALAEADVALSGIFLRQARERARGRLAPESVDPTWFIPRPDYDAASVLVQVASEGSVYDRLLAQSPSAPRYAALVERLAAFESEAGREFAEIPAGPTLREGDRDRRIVWLRARLGVEAPAGRASLFDAPLAEAVKSFQAAVGLNPDGLVGGHTLAALNASPDWRRAQVAANLERLRWLGGAPNGRYILVDTADARLRLYEDDALVLEMRTAVGTDDNQTPTFRGRMTYIVFRPYWNIPQSIAGEETLPKIRRDLGYLAEQGIEVLPGWKGDGQPLDPAAIDWESVDPEHLPFRLRQRPGPLNPLGNVKFMFPNRFNIYLHDTSNRSIFARDGRSLSHGCVRIQKPVDLATYLLRRRQGWDTERIQEAMSAEETSEIGLPEPIDVYLIYRTAFAAADGRVVFRRDLYERDRPLAEALGYLTALPEPEAPAPVATASD